MRQAPAFTWVEVLVAIAVLWIIAVIAIPNLPLLTDMNRMAKSQQTAMSLATLSLAVKNTGHPGWSNRSDAVRNLLAGVSVTNPADPRIVIRFQSNVLTPEECAAAAAYLTFDGTTLVYMPDGGQPTNL